MNTGRGSSIQPRKYVMRRNEAIAGYVFMLPLILGIILLTYGQFIYSLILSFTDKTVFEAGNFVGFENYRKLLLDDFFFWKAIKATVLYAFGSVIVTQLAALAVALLLNNRSVHGKAFFRTIFYIPSIVPAVASCLLWMWMFNPDFGLFNALLKALGLPTSKWIYAESSAVPSLILMSAWACGGPNNATLFVNYLIYRNAFQYNEFGYASALAWIVFAVLAICTLVIFRFFGKKVYYGDAV